MAELLRITGVSAAGPEGLAATLHRVPGGGLSHDIGVVFAVGGYQTRTGSHRQFLRLARSFAEAGYPCLRFDAPGLGDSGGKARGWQANLGCLRQAISALQKAEPGLRAVVLWGLCDGATAAALHAPDDARVAGLVLVNPWVDDAQMQAVALEGYYRRRLFSRAFWGKLVRGEVAVFASLRDYLGNRQAARRNTMPAAISLAERMAASLREFRGAVQVVIGGTDLTGNAFVEASRSEAWLDVRLNIETLAEADHTFSREIWHEHLLVISLQALERVVTSP